MVGLDAATLGNHEFDKGVPLLRHFLTSINFPIVSTNIDFSHEPTLAGIAPAPFLIKKVGGHEVAFIGATTTDPECISSPGPTHRFLDPVDPVQRTIDLLHSKGVNTIILISHLGYPADIDLVRKVSGLSLIVGAHTHTLLGNWSAIGLHALGDRLQPLLVADRDALAAALADGRLDAIREVAEEMGARIAICNHFAEGGKGAVELAEAVAEAAEDLSRKLNKRLGYGQKAAE